VLTTFKYYTYYGENMFFPPIVGKGFENSLPPNNDVSVRADLRRIKWIRNLMQNNGSKKMSNKDSAYNI
jgi:hypothetical protein